MRLLFCVLLVFIQADVLVSQGRGWWNWWRPNPIPRPPTCRRPYGTSNSLVASRYIDTFTDAASISDATAAAACASADANTRTTATRTLDTVPDLRRKVQQAKSDYLPCFSSSFAHLVGVNNVIAHPNECSKSIVCERPFSWRFRNKALIADCSRIPRRIKEYLRCVLKEENILTDEQLDLAMDIQYNPETRCCDFGYNVGCPNGSTPAAAINGQWSGFSAFSSCSAQCGGGTQDRTRTCTAPAPANGGADCEGKNFESRACNIFDCPDCTRDCTPVGGTLDNGCGFCVCNGETVTGTVRDSITNAVIEGASVTVVGNEITTMATTDGDGKYTINDICTRGLTVVVNADGYERKEVAVDGGVADANLDKIVSPFIAEPPQSVAAFVGQDVTLTCTAGGNPLPNEFKWYRNGVLLDVPSRNTLELSSVTLDSAGEYSCLAVSPVGRVMSSTATLTVLASGTNPCESCLQEGTTTITGCVPQTIKVFHCNAKQCAVEGEAPSSEFKCTIGATDEANPIVTTCGGETLTFPNVLSCECRKVPQQGVVLGVVVLNGVGVPNVMLSDGIGNPIGQTDSQGRFFLAIMSSKGQIAVTFSPSSGVSSFFRQVHVVKYDLDNPTRQTVILQPKPPKVAEFPGSSSTSVGITNSGGNTVVTVALPENAIIDSSGKTVSDTVTVFAAITNLENLDSLDSEVGVFETVMEDGEQTALETYGVFSFFVTNSAGDQLSINGEVTITVDVNALGIPPGSFLYSLNPITGLWNEIAPIETDSSRRKRQTGNDVTISNVTIPPNVPYINCDRPFIRDRVCYATVFVYSDDSLTIPVSGVLVKSFIPTEGSPGMFSGITSAVTDQNGRACLLVACGVPNHVIRAYMFGERLTPTANHKLPSGYTFINEQFVINGQTINQVVFSPDSKAILDNINPLTGPVYPRGHTNTCFQSTSADFHFQFKGTIPTGQLYPVEPAPNKRLSWYPLPENENRQAAFVAVFVKTNDRDRENFTFTARSSVNSTLESYGFYEVTGALPANDRFGQDRKKRQADDFPRYYLACLQVKVPGNVSDNGVITEDVATRVKIDVTSSNDGLCSISRQHIPYPDVQLNVNCDEPSSGDSGSQSGFVQDMYFPCNQQSSEIELLEFSDTSVTLVVQSLDDGADGGPKFRRFFTPGYFKAMGIGDIAQQRALSQCLGNAYYFNAVRFDCDGGESPGEGDQEPVPV